MKNKSVNFNRDLRNNIDKTQNYTLTPMEKFNILYVDDEPSNLRVFKDTYRRKFNVFTASSAKEGIKLLEKQRIDLILSDQRMPEMTGIELLKYSLERFPNINRILITGYSDIDAVENAINEAKVFQYIQKPWNEKSLSEVIDGALRIYQLEKDNIRQQMELQEAKEKAEENDMLKTEFLHNLSHEIRTPLNGIYGFAQLLGNEDISWEKRKEYVKIIQNSSVQLVNTVSTILDFSKLITQQVDVEKQEISLNGLLRELYKVFELIAKKKKIEFKFDLALGDNESFIYTDRTRLYQILSNILDNAFKYTETGLVKFGYELENDKIKVHIEDSGVGIHPDNQHLIFDRFTREEKHLSNNSSGLGLGLSISQENAKLIDALISFESEKDKGSVFYVELPFKPTKSSKGPNASELFSSLLANRTKKLKVLIVEDEEVNLYFLDILIKKITAPHDITILHAYNGKEAINTCKANVDLDMILMDIKMPILDGYEATRRIKEFMPKTPVIAQTAYSTTEDKEKAADAGCDSFIAKPIDKHKLEKIISVHLLEK